MFSLNLHGRLLEYDHPLVMGILNVTPDSFYAESRSFTREEVTRQAADLLAQRADIIDVGGYSTRPGAEDVPEAEEFRRVEIGVKAVRSLSKAIPISVDTFRVNIACEAITSFGADIVNDISGGTEEMFKAVAMLKAPYILTHNSRENGQPTSLGDITADVIQWFSYRLERFQKLGIADVILDPGFGFGKTLEQNFALMANLRVLKEALPLPLLIGISRKSMIYKTLNIEPREALTGTTVLNTFAALAGADILRVHDVKAARELLTLLSHLQ